MFGVRGTLVSMSVPTKVRGRELIEAATSHKQVSNSGLVKHCFPRVFLMVLLIDLTNLSHHPPHQGERGQLNFQVDRGTKTASFVLPRHSCRCRYTPQRAHVSEHRSFGMPRQVDRDPVKWIALTTPHTGKYRIFAEGNLSRTADL